MSNPTVYIYSKCSTCQKALRFLEGKKVAGNIKIKEIKETPPTMQELKKMLKFQNGNLKKLFNTSGMLYRELQLTQKLPKMTEEEALKLLAENGMLVKRPFLIRDDFGLTGFNEKTWEEALSQQISI